MARSVLKEIRRGQSILRSTTNVLLSDLDLRLGSSARILDAGSSGVPTTCWDSLPFPKVHARIALDLNPGKHPHLVADLEAPWPFSANSLDAVVSFFVLEHLKHPRRFFDEGLRCLKPGAKIVLTTVLMHPKHASPHDYFRFTDDCLVELARETGFVQAATTPLLAGLFHALTGMLSPWLLTPWVRYLALQSSRLADATLDRILPSLRDAWCVGYILVATKGASPVKP